MFFISDAWAQSAPAAAVGSTPNTFMQLLPMLAMFVVLYFIMIRPQMKRQKEHQALINALAVGDEVVTSAGILGKVTKLQEGYVTLRIAEGVEVQFQRAAVTQVLPRGTV